MIMGRDAAPQGQILTEQACADAGRGAGPARRGERRGPGADAGRTRTPRGAGSAADAESGGGLARRGAGPARGSVQLNGLGAEAPAVPVCLLGLGQGVEFGA